ncbi:unnamed protein product [Cylindrotheca closterium]|uniref:Uncharacterized protein n=1 Tax=Cylindrotheca closterium TaxID=2856 RepID=A0AAD2CSY8_9STRA|nr:unnamed protein product [Cylindrotheca closterium]
MSSNQGSAIKHEEGGAVAPVNDPSPPQTAKPSTLLEDHQNITHSFPPSHILEDGRFVYLPPANKFDRSKFFERSIARHGLLAKDMMGKKSTALEQQKEEEKKKKEEEEDKTAPQVHPLAKASARLNANGLAELNRVINLATLTTTGDYFGLTTVVDPALEAEAKTSEGSAPSAALGSAHSTAVKSTYILKRKRSQFMKASQVIERHQKRLKASIVAQRVIDRRLFQLRQQWRLVAPEHGTRARLHAAKPTEVVAIDVDVYDRDRVGGGNKALLGKGQQSLAGRLASRVPRFATVELKDDYKVPEEDQEETDNSQAAWTRAEPFAIADPTLGRVMENFDPSKVPMLNLQLEIQKASSGFLQSSCLKPMTTLSAAEGTDNVYAKDEELLVTLQHSLYCASLFESIRKELDPIENEGPQQLSLQLKKAEAPAWLSCESEENFLPAPSRLVGGDFGRGLGSLSIVHCHEGEVKVQLDAEYTLCVKLVEADTMDEEDMDTKTQTSNSGSQSPAQLQALCRALLLHTQNVYHQHSLYLRERAKRKQEEEERKKDEPKGLARIKKEDMPDRPKILASCVSLGSKMLFEKRIAKVITRVSKWLKNQSPKPMAVDWLGLSIFDLQSHFTISFGRMVLDVSIVRDSMTVTEIDDDVHKKVKFHSEFEFEIFLKMQLQRNL